MSGQNQYAELIKQEGEFWGRELEEQLKYGIPVSVDYERACRICRPLPRWWDDPKIFDIVQGDVVREMLRVASEIGKGGRALDLGCGGGWLSLELARLGLEVDAVDISVRSIEIAKRFLGEPLCGSSGVVNYQVADLNFISLEPNKYHLVVSNGSLHHIQRLDHLMEEVAKALKPSGILLIYDSIGPGIISKLLLKIFILMQSIKFIPCPIQTSASPFEGKGHILTVVRRYFTIKRLRKMNAFPKFLLLFWQQAKVVVI